MFIFNPLPTYTWCTHVASVCQCVNVVEVEVVAEVVVRGGEELVSGTPSSSKHSLLRDLLSHWASP